MTNTLLSVIKYLVLLAIAAIMLWMAFSGMDPQKIIDGLKEANIFWLVVSLLSGLGALISRAYRWKLLMEPLGFKVSSLKSFYSLSTGYLFNLALPRAGEITRCSMITRTTNVPFNSAFGTVITERILDVICLLILIFSTYFLEFSLINNFFNDNIFQPVISKFEGNTILLISLTIAGLAGLLIIYIFRKKILELSFLQKVLAFLNGLGKGVMSITKSEKPLQLVLSTLAIWIFYYWMTYAICFCFEATSHLGLVAGLVLLTVGGMGMSAPVQGGIGAFHIMVSSVLLLYGIDKTNGLLYATLLHGSQMIFTIFFGGISFLIILFGKQTESVDSK